MTVLKFRVVLDTKKDVFRDIEILTDQTFEEFHVAICEAFDLPGDEMASFYMSDDEWNRGQEITLMDMGNTNTEGGPLPMETTILDDMIIEEDERLVYVYDFLHMVCFFVELVEENNAIPGKDYPRVALKFGDPPAEVGSLAPDSMVGIEDDDEMSADGIGKEINEMFGDAEEEEEDDYGDSDEAEDVADDGEYEEEVLNE